MVGEEQERASTPQNSCPWKSSGVAGPSSVNAVSAPPPARRRELVHALAERRVGDLIVVLEKVHERGRRKIEAELAARAASATTYHCP